MEDHVKYSLTFMEVSDAVSRLYKNSSPAFKLADEDIMVADVIAAAVLSGTNMYLMGTKGEGKTLIAETLMRSVMNEDALYLRGDKDLNLKDLMIRLNLDGKTQDEIFQVGKENMNRPFFLVDELNRCIGLVQNQFLNIADGYVEIRGKKYYLGREDGYHIMVATGNPPRNGDYNVFDEDVALLDRIGLMLNVDDYEVLEADTADAKAARAEKKTIPLGDMRRKVSEAYKTVQKLSSDFSCYMEILSAYVYSRFLKMDAGGKQINKRQVGDWRALVVPGSAAFGDVLSYASDVSQRNLQEGRLAEALLLHIAALNRSAGKSEEETLKAENLVDAYLETLMMNLRYDRRFLPFDYIRENHSDNVKEYLQKVKESLKAELEASVVEECAGLNLASRELIGKGKMRELQDNIDYLKSQGTKPVALMTARMLQQRITNKMRDERRAEQKQNLLKMR